MAVKVNARATFPRKLDMFPYTSGKLDFQESDCEYELVGVIVHRSDAVGGGGHFISFVRDMDDRSDVWHEFDDAKVLQFDPNHHDKGLDARCFGGKYAEHETPSWWDAPSRHGGAKTENAFLLLYRQCQISAVRQYSPNMTTASDHSSRHGEALSRVSLILDTPAIIPLLVILTTMTEIADTTLDLYEDIIDAMLHYFDNVVFPSKDDAKIQE
jgi:hypothetical protein